MDDLIILGDTHEELDYWTCHVLPTMRESGLSCKPVKCQFQERNGKISRNHHLRGSDCYIPCESSIDHRLACSSKLCNVQLFLGTMNFWRKFIPGFSSIACPLHNLTCKDTPFEWTSDCRTAFDTLRWKIASEPILKHPHHDKPFILETNTSGFATRAVLMQEHEGKLHPVEFYLHSLDEAQCNYSTPDQELLAIILAMTHWCHLLEGACRPICIHTDNQLEALKGHQENRNSLS